MFMGTNKGSPKVCDPFVFVTSDREACSKSWYAALVQMNCEKRAATKLTRLGVTNYIPVQHEVHRWSDRKKKIDRIVIPMVVFVYATTKELDALRRYSFILRFVTYPGAKELATPIPSEQIEQLKFLLTNADTPISMIENLQVGDTVRIIGGPLKGVIGELGIIDQSKSMVAIRVDLLGYACVNISQEDIEFIKRD